MTAYMASTYYASLFCSACQGTACAPRSLNERGVILWPATANYDKEDS